MSEGNLNNEETRGSGISLDVITLSNLETSLKPSAELDATKLKEVFLLTAASLNWCGWIVD